MRAIVPLPGLLLALAACQGSLTAAGGTGADGGTGRDGAVTLRDGGGDAGGGGIDTGVEPPFDAGPCSAASLTDSFTRVATSGVGASGEIFAAPTDSGGAVVAWAGGSGVTLQRVAGDGTAVGSALTVDGNGIYGLDLAPSGWGVLVSRGTDALYLVVVEPSGATVFEERLLGEVDHDVTNNEWFGALIRAGRLDWTGSAWAAYYTVSRLWPDGIVHYGDQLRLVMPDGTAGSTLWDWGCSHSMEVRIEHNGTILGPVCASDCYPGKGIYFNHTSARLYTDPAANCAGGYGTTLGGVVPMDDGFWVSFTATDMRASHDVALVHVGNDRSAGSPVWLTEDSTPDANVHAERYGDDLVVAWSSGGTDRIARLDASGTTVEGPVELPGADLAAASDFFVYSNGDVGWATPTHLARLRHCP